MPENPSSDSPSLGAPNRSAEKDDSPVGPSNRHPSGRARDEGSSDKDGGGEPEMKREFRLLEWTTVVSNVVLAIAGICALFIYLGQLGVMRRQLDEMQSASTQTGQMIALYHQQVGQLKKQSADTHRLALAAVKEVDSLRKQADASRTIAVATRSASETARESLKVSDRAYVITGAPRLDIQAKEISFPLINNGHIPSGKVAVTVHEATINLPRPSAGSLRVNPVEAHWKETDLNAIPPTQGTITYTINTPVPNLDSTRLKDGRQQIFVVGDVSYGDGFSGDPTANWKFCEGYRFDPKTKKFVWAPCDWDLYIMEVMSADHYPDDEYKH